MIRCVVDEFLKRKLHGLTEPLELCDESGRVLARVTPALDLSEYEAISPSVSDEELDRRSKSSERRFTTGEVLDHLEKL